MNTQNEKQNYPNVKQSIGLILRMILISVIVGIPILIVQMIADKGFDFKNEAVDSLITVITYVIPIAWICIFGLKRIRKFDNPEFKLRFSSIDLKTSLILVIMTMAFIFVIDPIGNLMPMPDFFKELLEDAIPLNVFGFILVAIAAPVFEEILFRGIILEGFLKNYTPWKAILWSALLFGAFHLNPWQAIPAIGVGILIGWIYWRTRSILPGILIHFTNNFIGFLMMVYTDKEIDSLYQYFDNKILYFVLFAASLGIVYLGYKIINKRPLFAIATITSS